MMMLSINVRASCALSSKWCSFDYLYSCGLAKFQQNLAEYVEKRRRL
jgi:hypothetical protein